MSQTESTKPEAKPSSSSIKNIVICSDGTWQQGGSSTPTNVWRTYLAVDPENQVKFHDDGVGSGGARIQRIVGGAFGLGVSRNLIELIVSLSHVYHPDAKLFLFGFSRGAFTVRVLANLICLLGIPKVEGKSPDEVEQAAADLLAAYKTANSLRHSQLLDNKDEVEVWKKAFIENIRAQNHVVDTANRDNFPVHFLGCWDTVEAVGLPFDQLKQAAVEAFPLKFKNQWPSKHIRYMYQALSLDDERHTFHPIPWEIQEHVGLGKEQVLQQVWFPGSHAHVGGGYPKDQLALECLEWMLEKAEAAGLELLPDVRQRFRDEASRHGQIHESRGGFYRFYRYCPRRISKLQKTGKRFVHASALDRIEDHTDGYAPTAIDVPEYQRVENEYRLEPGAQLIPPTQTSPDFKKHIDDANRFVVLGRVLYFVCLIAWLVLLATGAGLFRSHVNEPQPLLTFNNEILQSFILWVYGIENLILQSVSGILPSFVSRTFLSGLRNTPGAFTLFVMVFSGLLYVGARLRQLIRECASNAWHCAAEEAAVAPSPGHTKGATAQAAAAEKLRQLRRQISYFAAKSTDLMLKGLAAATSLVSRPATALFKFADDWAWLHGWLTIVAVGLVALFFGGRFAWNSYHSFELTRNADHPSVRLQQGGASDPITFETRSPNFATGVFIEQGAHYEIQVDTSASNDWKDLKIDATAGGVRDENDEQFYHKWLKRNRKAPLFQLIASIGSGDDAYPIPIGNSTNQPFVLNSAARSGQLFLWVNDVPGFYANNIGTASVTVKRLEPPK